MPTSHGDLLTPTEHEAAGLLVTLACRLDGGQLVSADQLLARLCSIPTTDVAMASIVLLRQVAHSVALALQWHRSESSTTSAHGSPAEREHPASAARSGDPDCRRRDSANRSAPSRTNPYDPERPIRLRSLLTRANVTQANKRGRPRTRACLTAHVVGSGGCQLLNMGGRVVRRHELTDQAWAEIAPLLAVTGRPGGQ
jgi:hypothetical protein